MYQAIRRRVANRRTLVMLVALLVSAGFVVAHFNQASASVTYISNTIADNGGGLTTLTISNAASSSDQVLIAVVSVAGGTGVTITPPTGWVQINSLDSGTTLKSATFYRVQSATGEPASYDFSFSAAQRAVGVMAAYSGVDRADPINVNGAQANAASATMTAPSVTTTIPNAMLVALYGYAYGTTVSAGSGMTFRNQATTSSGGGSAAVKFTAGVQDIVQAAATASGTKTMTAAVNKGVSIGHLIALRPAPVISQSKYRFFTNTDSTTPGTPLAAIDTGAAAAKQVPFRLRINLGVATGGSTMTAVAGRTYKLQYSQRGTDNVCDAGFSTESYADVTTTSAVQFYDNQTPVDGAIYVAGANDPTRGLTNALQYYEEVAPMAVRTVAAANQDSFWDMSLTTSAAAAEGQYYCLRVVNGDGSNLTGTYVGMPQLYIQPPSVSQANYRWLNNADSITPGSALAAQDTAASLAAQTPFRLRQRLAVSGGTLGQAAQNYKLQYAEKSGSCNLSFSGQVNDMNPPSSTTSASKIAGSGADIDGSIRSWTTPENITTNDSATASVYVDTVSSGRLVSANHGFNIPANATITGISATADRSTLNNVYEQTVSLVRAGVVETYNAARPSSTFSNSDGDWGGTNDLWGASWTPADINNPGFGLGIAVASPKYGTAYVNYVSITVYYTLANGQMASATSAANDTSIGTTPWSNPSDAAVADGSSAIVFQSSGADTTYIKSAGHNYSVPAGATINGIVVQATLSSSGTVNDVNVRLAKAGVVQGLSRATTNAWTGTRTWGSANDLWGSSWTPADINNSGFGAALAARLDGSGTINVDGISVAVYFSTNEAQLSYLNNPTPTHNTQISSSSNDPTNGGRPVSFQSYLETDPYSNNQSAIASGSDGLWDYSLTSSNQAAGKTFCFRTVKSDGSLLDGYNNYAEITIANNAAGPTIDQQLRGGQSVLNGVKQPFSY